MNRYAEVLGLLRFHAGRLQWPAAAGIVLSVFATLLYFSGIRSGEQDLARATTEIVRLRAGRAPGAAPGGISAEQRLAEFHAFLPASTALPEALAAVHDAAETNAMVLTSAEYKETIDKGSRLLRYQMSLPVHGSYAQIRAWLADVMNGAPNAVLEDLSLKRESAATEVLDGRVRLSLYFKVL